MNTYLVKNDNSIICTERTSVVEKTNCIDKLQVIVPRIYNEIYDMSGFDMICEYLLPISKENHVITMTLANPEYKENFLQFTFPSSELTTKLTAEPGEVQMSFSFVKVELDPDGNTIERVRHLKNVAILKVLPLTSWFHVSDEALSEMTSLYVENKKAILALANIVSAFNESKADNIKLSEDK